MADDAEKPVRDYRETVFLPDTPFPMRAGLPSPRVWLIFRRSLTHPADVKTCPHTEFVRGSGLRWPIETALEEGKGEVGMDQSHLRLVFEKRVPRSRPLVSAKSRSNTKSRCSTTSFRIASCNEGGQKPLFFVS